VIALDWLTESIPEEDRKLFRKFAKEKIQAEGWAKQGRNAFVKEKNFYTCWVSEKAFQNLLKKRGIRFSTRGLYVGESEGAGFDFTVKKKGEKVTLGLRSIQKDSLYKYRSVAYPDDRFRKEQNKIADYIIVCHDEDPKVHFIGAIRKEALMRKLSQSKRLKSILNQEFFRVVPLEDFSMSLLLTLFDELDRL